jgi:hypothetical protein
MTFRDGSSADKLISIINSKKTIIIEIFKKYQDIKKFRLHNRIRFLELSTYHLFYSEFVKEGVCLFNLFGPKNTNTSKSMVPAPGICQDLSLNILNNIEYF